MVNSVRGRTLMENALAPALNTTPFTVTAEREMPVVLERANVAVSAGSLGTAAGVQLLAVFQSPEPGFVFHVALSANVLLVIESRSNNIATVTNNNGNVKPGRREGTPSEIDEERSTEVFIIESFQMIGTSPRRRRRRPPSAATGRIWCGAVTNQILLARGFANQDKKREVLENIPIHVATRKCSSATITTR